MRINPTLYASWMRKKTLAFIGIALFAVVGTLLIMLSRAEDAQMQNIDAYFLYGDQEEGNPGYDPSYVKRSPSTVQNTVWIGERILPTITLHPTYTPTQTTFPPAGKFAVVTVFYYPSTYVSIRSIHCEKSTRCLNIDLSKFNYDSFTGTSSNYQHPLTDRKFIVCSDRPNRNPALPFGEQDDMQLFSARFDVINDDDSFPIYAMSRVYVNGSCDKNNGVTDQTRGGGRPNGNCMNRAANKSPGNDGNGYPLHCGLGPNGGTPGTDSPRIEGGIGNQSNNPNGSGISNSGNVTSRGQSRGNSGGVSANTQNNDPNIIPNSSAQGDNEESQLKASPFFDGKEFKPGSDRDTLANTVTTTGKKLVSTWPITLGVLALGGFTGIGYWKWRK